VERKNKEREPPDYPFPMGLSVSLFADSPARATHFVIMERDVSDMAEEATILAVDDEYVVVTAVVEMLRELGYEAEAAPDGRSALELFSGNPGKFDAVILDLSMPGMDGMETFRRLREIDPEIRVVLSTGYGRNGRVQELLDMGVDGFLRKPFSLGELAEVLESVLGADPSASFDEEKGMITMERTEGGPDAEKLCNILDSIDEEIYVTDPDSYDLLYMNNPAVRIWGDRVGEKCYRVFRRRSAPCPFCTNPLIFGDDPKPFHPWTFQNPVNGKWYRTTGKAVEWSGNKMVRLDVAVEITDKVLTEKALRDSEERYRVLVESSLDAIFLETPDGKILECNTAACEMLGYSKEELVGMRVSDLLPAEDRTILPGILEDLKIKGKSFVESTNIRKDGTTIPVESWSRLIDTPLGKRVVVYVRDVTERKKAKEELARSEKRFRSFMDQLPAAAFLKDAGRRYMYVNSFMREVLGATDHWLGKTVSELFDEKISPFLTEDDVNALREGYSRAIRKLVDVSGNERYFEIHKFRISGGGEEVMLGGVALDVTERKRAEEKKRNLEAQMRHTQKLESLGVLAGGIAHDFNNILMAILGYADLALMDIRPGSPARISIEEMKKAACNAADLTRQMLAYSGKGSFQVMRLNLNDIIREMTHLLKISISKKAVIKYDLLEDLPTIEADPSQMKQVIMNLITNASDAMDRTSGVITITTNVMCCTAEYLRTAYTASELREGNYVYLEVSDTGCGMDEETLKRLFDPFFSTKSTGRGLGLSAVMGIIRGHGGGIKVYSEKGKGSSFKILLPAVEGEPQQVRAEEPASIDGTDSGTILVVDDEPSVRNITAAMLRRKGYKVIPASDGREALEIFRERHGEIDCVILDLTMPHVDGEETFREMRRMDGNVKVVMTSGYNKQDVTRKFVGRGLAGFIQKPFRLNELHAKIREVLGER